MVKQIMQFCAIYPSLWANHFVNMTDGSPFHAGERAIQERAGVRARMERVGAKTIREFMPDQHRLFFEELPFLLVGSLDDARRPWASMLVGRPGFVRSPDPVTLAVRATPVAGDPLEANLAVGAPIGVLGFQPETRRRNRANGTVAAREGTGFTLHVEQSFGNCPQYIQSRLARLAEPAASPTPRVEGAGLSAAAIALVRSADTFFIATGRPGEGVDVSHRGGKPGFVRVTAEQGRTVLTWPDFLGNSYFNTLGNLALAPRAGLLFVDFATGGILSLTGETEIVWDGAELAGFAGAERLVRFLVEEGRAVADAVPLRWSAPEFAPQLAATGAWRS